MRRLSSTPGRVLLAVALMISVWVGLRGISREESFFVQGDPPRYLLNGVFLYDLVRSGVWHPADVIPFAERYYARYPALSLGHHPPGLPISLVPFYAVFGVSVFAGRLAILTFLIIEVALLYRLTNALYHHERAAGWASILFASSPIIGHFGQRLLAETPTIAWTLTALIFLERFCRFGGLTNYLLFGAAAAVSLLCRPTAIYMAPAYVAFVFLQGGWHRLAERRVAILTVVGALLLGGMIVGYLALSPFNVAVVRNVVRRGVEWSAVQAMYAAIRLQWPLMIAMVGGFLVAVWTRDRRVWIPLAWIGSVVVCAVYLTGSIETGRYAVLAVPAYCIVGASPMAWARTQIQRAAWAVLLIVVLGFQLHNTWIRPTSDTPGYEAAARYVVSQMPTPTVLYSASVDTGYFIFFVRKHDPAQRLVIMRSNKVLTTSRMAQLSVENRIDEPEEIIDVLRTYGTRYIVIEDRPSGSEVLDWLRDVVKTDRFVERQRFPIGRGNKRLEGVSLAVYEYLDATDPAPDAELDLNILLIGRRIRMPLSELSPGR